MNASSSVSYMLGKLSLAPQRKFCSGISYFRGEKAKLILVMHRVIKAIYENDVLNPFVKLDLRDGEEVEIEQKRKAEKEQIFLAGR